MARFKVTRSDAARKARVILFRSEKEYEPYRPNEFAAAFYHPGEYHDFIMIDHSIGESRPVAVHELAHLMVHQIGLDLPPWLNEGLAELYSNLEPAGSKIRVGRDIPHHLRVLAAEKWIDLRTLLAVDHKSPYYNEKSHAGMFYAESWKLVHMLHLHPEYGPHLTDLLRALPKGTAEAAFRTAYGKSLDVVEHELHGYLSGGTIGTYLFDIQLPKSIDAPEIEPAASMFARLALGEMLSNTSGRAEQARTAYASIAGDYPRRWEVEEAMGLFAWHERKLDDAIRHFAKAEEMGCNDGGMFLLWGRVLGYANRTGDAVVALGKASRMMQESDDVQLELGNALIRNGNWGSGVAVLRTVQPNKVPAAGMWRYYYNLAYGLYKTGDAAGAKALVANARAHAVGARETAPLDQLAAALERPVRGAVAAVRDDPDGDPPRLVRRETAVVPPADAPRPARLPSVEGTLENMECGKLGRVHVRVDGTVQIFVIQDPSAIRIESHSGEPVELQCGVQKKPAVIRVEYQPVLGEADVAGFVRSLAFK